MTKKLRECDKVVCVTNPGIEADRVREAFLGGDPRVVLTAGVDVQADRIETEAAVWVSWRESQLRQIASAFALPPDALERPRLAQGVAE